MMGTEDDAQRGTVAAYRLREGREAPSLHTPMRKGWEKEVKERNFYCLCICGWEVPSCSGSDMIPLP
jgi:hypothetical protein